MKTKILNILLLLAVAMGFAACEDDTEPVLKQMSDLQITEQNAPATVTLFKDQADAVVFSLKWKAPEFNVPVARSYRIEAAQNEDFSGAVSVAVTSATQYDVKVSELNTAMREFYSDIKDCTPKDIRVRVRCELNDDANFVIASTSQITVNVTPYEGEYKKIYIIGDAAGGWDINNGSYFIQDMQQNGVFTGEVGLRANGTGFRFYTQLGDWDAKNVSYGSQVEDSGIPISLTNGVYEGKFYYGKGSWQLPEEGTYMITVDTNKETVKFEKIGPWKDTSVTEDEGDDEETSAGLFLIGTVNDWNMTNAADYALTETSEGSNVWTGTFPFSDDGKGNSYFRFYTHLDPNWGAQYSVGSAVYTNDGENEEITLVDGIAEVAVMVGSKGSFIVAPGTYMVTVDLSSDSPMMILEPAE